MKTYTPEIDAAVPGRLEDYAARFAPDFPPAKPAKWAGVRLQGLLLDGERKSIEPLSHRVTRPDGLVSADPEQALQPFVRQSPWDERRALARCRSHPAKTFAGPDRIFLSDDVSFPKPGDHAVGVRRPYCGAPGKKSDCRGAGSVHCVSPRGHYPPDRRLCPPDSRLGDTGRRDTAGVPEPERRPPTEPEIALELPDRVRREGRPGRLAAAGAGVSRAFRDGLAARGREDSVGVTADMAVFTRPPRRTRPGRSGNGRPRTRTRPADGQSRPAALGELAARVRRRRLTRRAGATGKMAGRFAGRRVWPGHGWAAGECAAAGPIRRPVAEPADGKLKFASADLPADASRLRAVRLWKSRWPVGQGRQQLKEELGPDHFEGRSWRGFRRHAAMAVLADGFLLRERRRPAAARPERVKKKTPSRS